MDSQLTTPSASTAESTITLRCCSRSPPTFPHNPGSAAALAEGRPGHIRDDFSERPVGPRLKTPVRAASPKLPKSPSSRMVGNDRPGRPSTILDPAADARPARRQRNGSPRRGTEAHRRPHTAAPAGTPEVSPQRGTSASAAAPALQQEQPVANGQPKEGNNAMARAPRRRRHHRRRGVWFRRKVPTFPVRVMRRSIEGVGEGTTSRDRSVGGG